MALLIAASAHAQDIAFSAKLSPAEIPYHRTATYTLRIEAPKGEQFAMPDLQSSNPDFSIRKGELRQTETETGQVLEQDYEVDAIRPGLYLFPGHEIGAGGQTLGVPPLVLSVRELTGEETTAASEFADLLTIEELAPAPQTPAWIYVVGGLLLGLLAVAGAYALMRRKSSAPVAPPEPAWVVAQRRLNELSSRGLAESGKYETYYVDLSAILRYYIEDRFALRAPEQTTPEFLESAASSGRLSDDHQRALSALLRHFDRVKFARYEPTTEEMENSFQVVSRFVQETIPQVEPEARAAA